MSYSLAGILGGTFDPIHLGHIALAEFASKHLLLPQIQFIPCLQPPHRPTPQANPQQRLEMIKLAIADHPQWIINDIDYHRPPPSYMVDTLSLLRRQQPKTAWCLILGMDAFAEFNRWHQWQQILDLAHLIVVNRPEYELPTQSWTRELLDRAQVNSTDYFKNHLSGGILLATMPPSPISATAIRQAHLHSNQQSVWLSPAVLEFIRKHHLYTPPMI